MFTKLLTRAPRYILIKAFFLAIPLSYLLDLSHAFLKRLKLLWGEIAFQNSSLSTDNGRTSILSSFHRIFNHPNYLDISIPLLPISLKLQKHRGGYWRKKLSWTILEGQFSVPRNSWPHFVAMSTPVSL